ncbi:phosphatase PAP2 family protein [Halopelagius longus]|uniref:Inositol phosphorylceramide synthase n=1 Tax=Halopelagius longus TaxID=1236180 RepID=A0A1H1G7C3_9EURY|nr:phosphatase PAP2 family protein [Halopelagius longus]RDI69804.1 inositol phosphorylceramide synthase [Halopelagius longus]SDR08955.1 PAP2 superfamily protein [Halopelagius longus]
MGLLEVAAQVVGGVLVLFAVALVVVVGPARLRSASDTVRSNLRTVARTVGALFVVLAANGVVRDVGLEVSWLIGVNITGYIHAVEGEFVAVLQSFATPALTAYFGFVYVFGYVFLLTFPLAAYLLHDDPRSLYEHLVAYIVNYGVGLVCYVVFIAYGPRNFMPELVESLLYTTWPEAQLLTTEVNRNTNVFPSLHTSLSVTVALLAYRFRHVYPRWYPISVALAASISVSTMYLGIHWATDVVAGLAVAGLSVSVARRAGTGPDRDSERHSYRSLFGR